MSSVVFSSEIGSKVQPHLGGENKLTKTAENDSQRPETVWDYVVGGVYSHGCLYFPQMTATIQTYAAGGPSVESPH